MGVQVQHRGASSSFLVISCSSCYDEVSSAGPGQLGLIRGQVSRLYAYIIFSNYIC